MFEQTGSLWNQREKPLLDQIPWCFYCSYFQIISRQSIQDLYLFLAPEASEYSRNSGNGYQVMGGMRHVFVSQKVANEIIISQITKMAKLKFGDCGIMIATAVLIPIWLTSEIRGKQSQIHNRGYLLTISENRLTYNYSPLLLL